MKQLNDSYTKSAHNLRFSYNPLISAIVSPNMQDFASQGLWHFPDVIFNFLFLLIVEDNWGKTSGVLLQLKLWTWFSLYWSHFLTISIQFIVIIDYFLGKIHIESMHWPKQNKSCQVTDTWTTQHMHDQTMSVQSSHSSPRCTQVSWV